MGTFTIILLVLTVAVWTLNVREDTKPQPKPIAPRPNNFHLTPTGRPIKDFNPKTIKKGEWFVEDDFNGSGLVALWSLINGNLATYLLMANNTSALLDDGSLYGRQLKLVGPRCYNYYGEVVPTPRNEQEASYVRKMAWVVE